MGEAELAAVKAGPTAPSWSPRERVLMDVVEELHHDGDVSDATWSALDEHLDDPRKIELLLLAGHDAMLATTLNALRLEPDAARPAPRVLRRLSALTGSARSPR